MLDGQGTNVGDFCISAYETPPPPPPIGAICSNPRDLFPASDCNNVQGTQYDEQSNIIQTDPATGGDAGQGVTNPPYVPSGIDGTCTTDNDGTQMPYWIRFTATVTTSGGNFTRITNSGNCPQDYTVFSGTCGALTQTNCFANVAAGGAVNLTVTAGVTYYVMITNSNGSTCTNRFMCLTSSVPYTPPNDNCASALNVTAGTVYNLSNANATADRNLCSGSMENNIWTVWTCPMGWTGSAYVHLYNQDCACGNGLQMSIFTAIASCPPNANPTCMLTLNPNNDNDFYGQFTPVPGSTYYITIDGYAGCACNFDFTILNTPVLLPASGVVVNAVRTGQDVLLRWTAEAETNVSHYDILKDVGGNGWIRLDQVAAAGHSALPVSYTWTHTQAPQSFIRYGIRSIDMDGAQSEITQVSVYPGSAPSGLMGIHPQPAGNEVNALLNLEQAAQVRWQVTDTRGRILLQGDQACQEGSNTLTLDLRDLPTGLYFLSYGMNGSRETVRLLK